MNGFIDWLEKLNQKDSRVRAVLRRSLAFEPGKFVQAFPYVEPFLKHEENVWIREMYYLVAGLWSMHHRERPESLRMSLGQACAVHMRVSGSSSTERRFISMLDADSEQLPHRLRQMVSLLKEYPIDFEALLKGLRYWNDDQKRTQNRWARDFYQNLSSSDDDNQIKETNG